MVSFKQITRCAAIAFAFVAMTNCSESATSPTGSSLSPSFSRSGPSGNSGRWHDRFSTSAGEGNFTIGGNHHIYISRRSICDKSGGYGPGTWNLPCNSETKDVGIDAQTSTTVAGHTRIDFNPPMRFNPNADDVILMIYDPKAAADPKAVIYYCNDLGVCVDEGKTDPALVTHRSGNYLWKKIRHFSGYVVGGGDCDPTIDPTCGQQ